MAYWRNADGDLLMYALQYRYPVNSTPALSTVTVGANIIRAKAVRVLLDGRDLLQAPLLPDPSVAMNNRPCAVTTWSDFVKSKSPKSAPVAALPTELADIKAIAIESDSDGLAERIARMLREQVPTLQVGTPLNPLPMTSDATLDFTVDCHCGTPGKPNVFYVREAVLYKRPTPEPWAEPARVLFYWSGDDAADLAFVGSLASSINAVRDRH
jgi:hypothetical protein